MKIDILDILSKLSIDKMQMLMRVIDGGILFLFIAVFFTSVIINIKNRNIKSMLISLVFIIFYGIAATSMFFGVFLLRKFGIPIEDIVYGNDAIISRSINKNYYIAIGICVFIQIVMMILLYIFADPFAREKKIEHMKETGEYDVLMKKKRDKIQAKIDKKTEKKRIRREKREAKRIKRQEKKKERLAKKRN